MTLVSNSTKYYAEASFDKWAGATIADLQFPDSANNLLLKQNLTNLVVASDYSGVRTGSYAQGRIEFWSHCYGTGNTGYAPFGNDGLYDWDDAPSGGVGCYGSSSQSCRSSRDVCSKQKTWRAEIWRYQRWAVGQHDICRSRGGGDPSASVGYHQGSCYRYVACSRGGWSQAS